MARNPAHKADWPAVLDVLGVAPVEALAIDVRQVLGIRAEVLRLLDDARQGQILLAHVILPAWSP